MHQLFLSATFFFQARAESAFRMQALSPAMDFMTERLGKPTELALSEGPEEGSLVDWLQAFRVLQVCMQLPRRDVCSYVHFGSAAPPLPV